MSMLKSEIMDWLESLEDTDEVFIDDGGLCLSVIGNDDVYLEVGGYSFDDEDDGGDGDYLQECEGGR
jgi:hypothetical protein